MAELATIARPYAEALFKAGGDAQTAQQLNALAAVAADARLQQFADNPKAQPDQVYDLITSVANQPLSPALQNFLRTVIDNGRLAALPEVAIQFRLLKNVQRGASDAVVYSAFPIDEAGLKTVAESLERRFGRKLNTRVELDPSLIGGIRAVVGDEVLDTSVKARLEQMKAALTA